jgi:hypothetical protein
VFSLHYKLDILTINQKSSKEEAMQAYKIFRALTLVCLIAIVFISGLFYFGFTDTKNFAVLSGIIAILATILGIFASKPLNKNDFAGAVDQVLLTYDQDVYAELQKAKKEEQIIRDFIEHRSEELLLLKFRSFLAEELKTRYEELSKVEEKLDSMHVQYGVLQLPDRFRNLLEELDLKGQQDVKNQLITDMVEAVPLPFLTKGLMRLSLSMAEIMMPVTVSFAKALIPVSASFAKALMTLFKEREIDNQHPQKETNKSDNIPTTEKDDKPIK